MNLKFELLAFAICMAVGLALEFVLRCLPGEWWLWPWIALVMPAQVTTMVIPDRHYARFRVWLDKHGMA